MHAKVIDRVCTFCHQDQTNRAMGLQICDCSGHLISDSDEDEHDGDEGPDDNDSDYDPLNDSDPDDDDHAESNLYDDDQSTHNKNQYDDMPENVTDENTMTKDGNANGSTGPVLQIHPDGSHMAKQDVGGHDTTENVKEGAENNAPDSVETIDTTDATDKTDITTQMDQLYGSLTAPYNLCPCKPHEFSHLHAVLESMMMTEYNMKKGSKCLVMLE